MHCPACGVEQPEGARFCKSCGGPMEAPAQQPDPAAAYPAAAPAAPAAPVSLAEAAHARKPAVFLVAGLVVLLIIGGVALLLVLGGSGDVAGTYYSKNGGSPLVLESDGTFAMDSDFMELEGTYEVDGNQLTLTLSLYGFETTIKGVIEGNRITIEGEIYEKK